MLFRQLKIVGVSMAVGAACVTSCGSDDETTTACSDTVTTKADPTGDFAHYTTFAVVPKESYPSSLPDDVKAALIDADSAAATQMLNMGLTEVAPNENPSVLLFSLARTTDETALYWQCYSGYWYGYWNWYWDPCTWLTTSSVDYSVGTLVVGVSDPAMGKVVFAGAVQGILECSNDVRGRINSGVQSVFANYPHSRPTL